MYKNLIPNEFIILDIETTGFNSNKDEIIEIGALHIRDYKVINEFSSFLNPGPIKLSQEIVDLTGITEEDLATSKNSEVVLKEFNEFSNGLAAMAHNAKFDKSFMDSSNKKYLRLNKFNTNMWLDSILLSKEILTVEDFPELAENGKISHSAKNLSGIFGIPYENAHRALIDCYIEFKILLNLLKLTGEEIDIEKSINLENSKFIKSVNGSFFYKTKDEIFETRRKELENESKTNINALEDLISVSNVKGVSLENKKYLDLISNTEMEIDYKNLSAVKKSTKKNLPKFNFRSGEITHKRYDPLYKEWLKETSADFKSNTNNSFRTTKRFSSTSFDIEFREDTFFKFNYDGEVVKITLPKNLNKSTGITNLKSLDEVVNSLMKGGFAEWEE